ncbi:hypothetical protein [Sphingomonas sp.]|uniref:hypothetical protein n=1 Tax=Sphingomonas sp. TaxID=28214 RepID=UPI0035C8608D
MKRISTAVLAAALVTGAVATAPATAAKKEENPSALKPSPDVLKAAQAAQAALTANDLATAEPAIAQAEAAAKSEDDKYISAALRLSLESRRVQAAGENADATRLAAPLDVLIVNSKTPAADKPKFAFERGLISFRSKQYPVAVTYFEKARELGSTDPRLSTQLVMAKVNAGDTAGGMTELDKIITQTEQSGQKADEQLYRFALSRTIQAKDGQGTLTWMKRYLAAYPTAKNWRDMIKIYGLQQGSFITPSKAQSLDLYRLMRATNSLADQYDYETYAVTANQLGLPWEAKAVITEGRAKGKLPSTGSSAQLLSTANSRIASEGSLTALETKSKSAADGKLASQTGDAQLGSGNYAKAAELYRLALQKGGVNAAEINTRLGVALAMGGDKAAAKTAFQGVTGSPSAEIAALWMTYLDLPAPTA